MTGVLLWRIGSDTPEYTADDATGTGAKITGGRWNRQGLPVIYTASNIALAALETVVHLGGLPLNRYLVRVEVPDEVWQARKVGTQETLPVGWDALPAGKVSLDAGDAWLKGLSSALFAVPSVIVPEEFNVLINPGHQDAKKITLTKLRRFQYDARLRLS